MRSVIFDLDGTLADTAADLVAAANHCFVGLGLGELLDPVGDAKTALRGGKAMLRLGFSRVEGYGDEAVEREYPLLLEAYGEAIAVHTRLYPGTLEAAEALRREGYALAICTNKPEGLAVKLMTALGELETFGPIIGADTLAVRKPDPAPFHEAVARAGGTAGRACLVGDTVTDRETARAAGAPSLLVSFGPAGGEMAALEPAALVPSYAELPGIVNGLRL
ncbi:HAD-IA family hydrolase [Pseudoroseicyclus tamaricis]|uniref:phosphoglycolate phosphatase n=1 Tax=Pseudoroseicyclus tamaricis TaxID=2705421 RepID=A0A6B2JZG2_9RHOB|nr:HAD-IA family hydrolase [Pseudoroseicyclus tamaricis]NDV01654.1 HAD-IA family hydrolase [Pseudoroseicyclus tamaricis]